MERSSGKCLRSSFICLLVFGCPRSSLLQRLFSSCIGGELLSSCDAGAYRSGFSCCRAPALGMSALEAVAPRLYGFDAQALWLQGMWDLPGSRIKSVSPALAGRIFTTEPPQKSVLRFLNLGEMSSGSHDDS